MSFGVMDTDEDYYTGESQGSLDFGDLGDRASSYDYGGSVATSIANELVKSYGLRYERGEWTWSLENVGKAFKEDPIWTSLDYVLLAAPLGKMGKAAFAVSRASKSTGLAKRAYQAGAFVGKTAQTRKGRFVEDVASLAGVEKGRGFGAAVEFEMKYGLPKTKVGRFFSSNVARNADADPDYLKFATEYGRDPEELRGLHDLFKRERAMEIEVSRRTAENLVRTQNRVLKDQDAREAFYRALSTGVDPKSDEALRLFGDDGLKAYQNTWDFRLKTHNRAHELGLISDEAWEAGYEKYMPRLWAEYFGDDAGRAAKGARRSGRERALSRKLSESDIDYLQSLDLLSEQVLDPAASIMKLADFWSVLATQGYFQRLASSAIAKNSDEVVEHVTKVMTGSPDIEPTLAKAFQGAYSEEAWTQATRRLERQAALRGIGEYEAGGMKTFLSESGLSATDTGGVLGALPKEAFDDAARAMGWRSVDELYGGEKIPGYLKRIPEELRGKFIDPAVAEDLAGLMQMSEQIPGVFQSIYKLYMGSLAMFKGSKTAYNPPTVFRNAFGAMITHHLTVGGGGAVQHGFFTRGIKALHQAEQGPDWKDIVDSGLIGSSFQQEVAETVAKALGKDVAEGGSLAALLYKLPIVGDKWITKKAVQAGSRAERFYRYIDEVAKVDGFLIRRDAWMKKLAKEGLEGEALRAKAIANATADVAKFQPMFVQNSPFTDLVRNAIPFASFTTEAVRIWKNAMIEKPHLAFFWNHIVEAGSQITGAMAGFDPEELQQAQEAMPYFMEGKKMLAWPFRVNDKPVFLDMSYMIPMANISEYQQADATFFDFLQIDPFTNPVLSTAAAVATGVDPFTKQEVAPRALERQFGVTVEQPVARRAVGLVEHMAKLMLPPLVPPGYSGVNLLEWARGEKHPLTGAELEQGVLRTLGANLAGIRLYEADVNSQLLNVKREESVRNERTGMWWERWRHAAANGDAGTMRRAIDEIRALRAGRGDSPEDITKYIQKGIEKREPGKFRTLSTRQIQETLRRSEGLDYRSEDDRKMMGELMARLQERAGR